MKLSYIYNIKRTIHQTTIQWNYNRNILRRMKKSELVDLAQQEKLSTIGTKNDIIERILSKPLSSSSVETKAVKKETKISENNKQKETVINKTQDLKTTTTITAINNDNNNTKDITVAEDDDKFDEQWVEAFDLKVTNRSSSMNSFSKERFEKIKQDKPSVLSQQQQQIPSIKEQLSSSSPLNSSKPQIVVTLIDSKENEEIEFDDPEINQHWVKAFDQRVKHHVSVKPKGLSNIEYALPEEKITFRQSVDNLNNNNNSNDGNGNNGDQYTNNIPSSDKSEKKEQSSNIFINSIMGSSLLFWYIKGEDGIQSIISFFSS